MRSGSIEVLLVGCRLTADPSLQPFAFAAREYLRPMMVGKIVQFTISHAVEGSKMASNGAAVGDISSHRPRATC